MTDLFRLAFYYRRDWLSLNLSNSQVRRSIMLVQTVRLDLPRLRDRLTIRVRNEVAWLRLASIYSFVLIGQPFSFLVLSWAALRPRFRLLLRDGGSPKGLAIKEEKKPFETAKDLLRLTSLYSLADLSGQSVALYLAWIWPFLFFMPGGDWLL